MQVHLENRQAKVSGQGQSYKSQKCDFD